MTARRALAQRLAGQASVALACRALGLSTSSYYYHPRPPEDLEVLGWIEEVWADFPTYGYRRLEAELARREQVVNHKRLQRILNAHDLVRPPRPRPGSGKAGPMGRYPNLLAGLGVERPDQVWCADLTYVRMGRGFVYLAVVLDVFTRAIRGWEVFGSLASELACGALRRALERGTPEIHHSNQGIQYAAEEYVALLAGRGVRVSLSGRGRPTDNPYAERVIRTLKEEEVYLIEYRSLSEAREEIGRFIDQVYNTKRIHSALGYLTPAEYEAHRRAERAQESASPPLGG